MAIARLLRLAPVVGLVIAAAAAALILAPTAALGTALCEDAPGEESGCGLPYEKNTVFKATSTNTVFSTSLGTIACLESKFEAETTQDATGSKEPLSGLIKTLSFSGCKVGSTPCTVKVSSLPSISTSWTEKANGTLKFSEAKDAAIECEGLFACAYSANPIFAVTGGEAGKATLTLSKESLTVKSGAFCPKTAAWTATYVFTAPLGGKIFEAAKDLPPTVYCQENMNPCPKNKTYGKTAIEAKLIAPETIRFKWEGMIRDTCTGSVIKANTQKIGTTTTGEVTEWSFSGCTCETKTVRLPWDTRLNPSVPGKGIYSAFSGGGGDPIFEMVGCNKPCNFTSLTVVLIFDGGNPAHLLINGQVLPENSGGCGAAEIVGGEYQVEIPKPVWIEKRAP